MRLWETIRSDGDRVMTTKILNDILEAVSEKTGRDIEDLPPLQYSVDVPSIERLSDDATLEFRYVGMTVRVDDGEVNVQHGTDCVEDN